jgi:hypothetical protein
VTADDEFGRVTEFRLMNDNYSSRPC